MYRIDSQALKVEHKKVMCYIKAALKQLYRGSCLLIAPCCYDHYAVRSLLGWIFTCGRWLGKNKTCNVQKKNGSVLSSWSAPTVNRVYSTSSRHTWKHNVLGGGNKFADFSYLCKTNHPPDVCLEAAVLVAWCHTDLVSWCFIKLHKHTRRRRSTNKTVNKQTDSWGLCHHPTVISTLKLLWAPRTCTYLRVTLSTELPVAKERTAPPSVFDWQVNKGQREHTD